MELEMDTEQAIREIPAALEAAGREIGKGGAFGPGGLELVAMEIKGLAEQLRGLVDPDSFGDPVTGADVRGVSSAIELLATAVGELQSPESRTEREGSRCESPGFVTRLNAAAEYLRAEETSRLGSLRPTEEKRLREALEWIGQQFCERSPAGSSWLCAESGDCITEWCLPCYARAALGVERAESGTEPTQEKES